MSWVGVIYHKSITCDVYPIKLSNETDISFSVIGYNECVFEIIENLFMYSMYSCIHLFKYEIYVYDRKRVRMQEENCYNI